MQDVEPSAKTSTTATPTAEGARPIRPPIDYGMPESRHPLVDRIIDGLKTFAWVAPLTLLIWIYAERKQSDQRDRVPIPVEVRINSKDKIVILKNPPDQNFIATLKGPRGALQRVIDTIGTPLPGNHSAVQITIDSKTSGDVTLTAQDYLRRNPLFAQAGIAVSDVIPSTMSVSVLDLEDRVVPVRAPEGIPNLANPRFVPAEVTVRAPRTVLDRAAAENRLYVIADLTKVEAVRQTGHHDVNSVPIATAFPNEYVTLDPRAVTASFEVNRADAEATLDFAVPVWPAAPVSLLQKSRIDCKTAAISGLHVKGPQDQVDAVKSQAVRVVALLYVFPEDVTGVEKRRLLKIDLPPGVQVTDDTEQYTVTFSAVERDRSNAPAE